MKIRAAEASRRSIRHVILRAACAVTLLSACSKGGELSSTPATTPTPPSNSAQLPEVIAAKVEKLHAVEECPNMVGLYGRSKGTATQVSMTAIEGGYVYNLDGQLIVDGQSHPSEKSTFRFEGSYVANCKNNRVDIKAQKSVKDVDGNSQVTKQMYISLYPINEEMDFVFIVSADGESTSKELLRNFSPQALVPNLSQLMVHNKAECPSLAGAVQMKEVGKSKVDQGTLAVEHIGSGVRYSLSVSESGSVEKFFDIVADGKARRASNKVANDADSVRAACSNGKLHMLWLKKDEVVQHWIMSTISESAGVFELRGQTDDGEIKSYKVEVALVKP